MDWLMHNFIADMYGPAFLLFYGLMIGFTVLMCWILLRQSDSTASLPLPHIPLQPDPYEIAYLRGGENEVVRVVIFNLIQRGYLGVAEGTKPQIERLSRHPDPRYLTQIERSVFDWFSMPHPAEAIFQSRALPSKIEESIARYEQQLRREQLVMPPDVEDTARGLRLTGLLVIIGLGGYKLLVALAKGRTNVAFLIIMGLAGGWILWKICQLPWLSRRGQAYLERLQSAFEGLKDRAPMIGAAAADPSLPLLVGVFGVEVLAGTFYDNYQSMFRRAATSGGSWGGDGSFSSCGSSCGSCGGGGCGGGCGGCGGCGG